LKFKSLENPRRILKPVSFAVLENGILMLKLFLVLNV